MARVIAHSGKQWIALERWYFVDVIYVRERGFVMRLTKKNQNFWFVSIGMFFFVLRCNVNFFLPASYLWFFLLQSCFDSGNESFSRSKSCRLQKHDAAFYSRANRLSSKGKFDKICVVSHLYEETCARTVRKFRDVYRKPGLHGWMVRPFDIPNNGQTRMELLPKVGLNNLAMWRALTFFFLKKCIKAI